MALIDDIDTAFSRVSKSLRLLTKADDLLAELVPTTSPTEQSAGEAEPSDDEGEATKG